MAIDTLGANALASNSVTSAKIADDTVVAADIADGSITTAKLATPVTLVGANTLTLRNDTSTDADEPKLIFDNDSFAGANYANITTGNGGLLMKIESPSTSTFQNRHQIVMNAGGSDDIQFNSSTNNGSSYTTQMKIEAGDVTISNGNLVIGTSGKGIDFSAASGSASGSSSALLDDYEEGTWTPGVNSGTVDTSSYPNAATYTKIGRLVIAFCRFNNISDTSSNTHFTITGLPFITSGGPEANIGNAWGNEVGNARAWYLYSGSGGSTVSAYYSATGNSSYDSVQHSELGGNTNMLCRFIYFTS